METKPYPKPRVERENKEYAYLLLQDYAGDVSEETGIHLYIYQSFLEIPNWKPYACEIQKIAETEMHHLKLLGKTISLLGVNPVFATRDCALHKQTYWTADHVNFTTDFEEMLRQDIQSETIAIRNYEAHIHAIKDQYIVELLKRIVEDEIEHLHLFEQLLSKLKQKKTP